jgi:dipeptidyl aminopeptidase/acylaminoacyl peptidase
VPLKAVEKFAERMRSLGKRFEMTVVWDEGNGIQRTKNLARQYKAVVRFLDREFTPTGST